MSNLKNAKSFTHTLNYDPEWDTVHIREADSLFQVSVGRGMTNALSNRYNFIRPKYDLAQLYFLNDQRVQLTVPVGIDRMSGRILKMVVLKENKYKKIAFVEKEPTAAWFQTSGNGNYDEMTGTLRIFNSYGTLFKAYNVQNGLAISEIPVGGGTSIAQKSTSSKPLQKTSSSKPLQSTLAGESDPEWKDKDDDNDGVPNGVDKCPGTPANLWVGPDGCILTMDIDVVTVTANFNSGFVGFPQFYTLSPTPPGPIELESYPVDPPPAGGYTVTYNNRSVGPFGDLCGTYGMAKVGNAFTGQITNLREGFVNPTTGQNFIISWPNACITVTLKNTAIASSNEFVDAFNYAAWRVVQNLNDGVLSPVPSIVKEKLRQYTVEELERSCPGSKFTDGPCLLGVTVPVTAAKLYNPLTGNCE
ncbi:thrombospondin type 3 repeat-containing protein [Chitinophaga oryzae]|uniref:Thrombospondin type 3 repeat-containing protein n=1 Tax=Chitinophaga oryzae TaxID=2725414 RepID=A0ABX6TRH1_9BACT|nr:thrombospondin type 3 repeat-containing protein [Chitinophaga oryzae]